MEEFANLPWRISEPSIMDVGTNFIKEENIEKSLVFQDNFVPIKLVEDEPKKANNNPKRKKKIIGQYDRKSALNELQHQQCLEALDLLNSERPLSSYTHHEQQLINIYNKLKSVIYEENVAFSKYVEQKWNRILHLRTNNLSKFLQNFALAKRAQKFDTIRTYPEFYSGNIMIPFTQNHNSIEFVHEACLLELGVVGKLIIPNIEINDSMYINKLPSLRNNNIDDTIKQTELSVSQDVHAEFLAKQINCHIVISSSGLKRIVDNFGPDFNINWDLPIIVKQYVVGLHKFNVVYIDKPLPQKNISTADLNYTVRKILLKRTMCCRIAHSLPVPDFILNNLNKQTADSRTPKQKNASETNESSPRNKKIMSPKTDSTSTILTRSAKKKLTENSDDEKNSQISSEKQVTDEEVHLKEDLTKKSQKKLNVSINQNVSYRFWKIKNTEEENVLMKNCSQKREIKVLIRTKTDGYQIDENGQFVPINLAPKLEFQAEHGGEIISKSELLRQWSTLYFRPFSKLLRVRINPTGNKYLKFEHLNLHKITNECLTHHKFVPKESLGILYSVFSNLSDLQPGKYILHHASKHGPFAAIQKNVPEKSENVFSLYDSYREENCNIVDKVKWTPIDTTLILPHNIRNGMMPGLFPPRFLGKKALNKNKKKQMKKNKIRKVVGKTCE